ncbi:hypothetical protein Tco_1140986, partial [Tanacetum coccineum]
LQLQLRTHLCQARQQSFIPVIRKIYLPWKFFKAQLSAPSTSDSIFSTATGTYHALRELSIPKFTQTLSKDPSDAQRESTN